MYSQFDNTSFHPVGIESSPSMENVVELVDARLHQMQQAITNNKSQLLARERENTTLQEDKRALETTVKDLQQKIHHFTSKFASLADQSESMNKAINSVAFTLMKN